MNFIITFILLSIVNVIFSTVRSIITIKGGRRSASFVSAGYFAFYNIVLLYTVADFPMWEKCVITFICNYVGVSIVKFLEKRFEKERLWKIECSVSEKAWRNHKYLLENVDVPHNYHRISGGYIAINFYCKNKEQTSLVKPFIENAGAHYVILENKNIL